MFTNVRVMTIIAILIIVIAININAFTQDYILVPVADATLRGGEYSNTNYGLDSILVIKNEGNPGATKYWREAVLKFDLSQIEGPIISAILKLFDFGNLNSFVVDSINHVAYFIEDDNWNEMTVAYNTRPPKSCTVLGEWWTYKSREEIPGRLYSGWYECELLLSKISEQINGDKILSLNIYAITKKVSGNDPDTYSAYCSKDHSNSNLRPRLEITTYIPQADWKVPIRIDGADTSFIRTFGGDVDATQGFDNDMDIQTVPPGATYCAYFSIIDSPYSLDTDIRPWISPYIINIDWTLEIINASGIISSLSWIPENLPDNGFFTLEYDSITIDMNNENSTTVTGNSVIMIKYCSVPFIEALFGNYLALDGVDDYAEAEDHYELDVGDEEYENITVEAWVNLKPFSASQLIIKPNAYQLYTDTGNEDPIFKKPFRSLGFSIKCGNYTVSAEHLQYEEQNNFFWKSGWHHVAFAFSQEIGEVYLYMDGLRVHKSELNVSQPRIDDSNYALKIGLGLTGGIDEVRISENLRYSGYSFTIPKAPFEPDDYTRALWHFDEPIGSTEFHDICGLDNLLIGHYGAHSLPIHIATSSDFPDEYQLLQNYPNPFNGTTTIMYQLPKTTHVTIQIYNILGTLRTTLLNEKQQQGNYKITWNGKDQRDFDMSSGLYFYFLKTEDHVRSGKMILMR